MTDHMRDVAQGTRGNLSDDIEYAIRLAREDRANNAIEYLIWMGRKYAQPPAAPAAQPRQQPAAYRWRRNAESEWRLSATPEHETTRAHLESLGYEFQELYPAAQPPAAPAAQPTPDPFNRKQVEAVCRAVCKVEGLDPDDDTFGDGCDPAWTRYADAVAEVITSQPPAAPVDLINRLRSMPSSLNDALRTMEEAADFLAGAPAAPVETGALDPLSMLLDAALYAQSIKPEWAKAARRAVATARAVQRSSAAAPVEAKDLAIEVAQERIAELINERDAALAQVAALQSCSAGSANDFERPFQNRVLEWLMACFSMEVCRDGVERNHRFLEEALELVQALGCTRSEAHQLVDYVFDRPAGEPMQELGGVMVTLAALCFPHDLNMNEAAERELARVWTKIDKIRAKQAAKPKHSPLPQHVTNEPQQPPAQIEPRPVKLHAWGGQTRVNDYLMSDGSVKAMTLDEAKAAGYGVQPQESPVLDWLATRPNYELSFDGWNEDPTWNVHSVNGGRNDLEWTLLATGNTPEEALRKAMSLSLPRPQEK